MVDDLYVIHVLRGRADDDLRLRVLRDAQNERLARVYSIHTRPDMTTYIRRFKADIFRIMYSFAPPEFLEWYERQRVEAVKPKLDSLIRRGEVLRQQAVEEPELFSEPPVEKIRELYGKLGSYELVADTLNKTCPDPRYWYAEKVRRRTWRG